MKPDLLDAYNIRVRLSASIILLAPIAVTVFMCFNEVTTLVSSSIIVSVLLALTNYIPLLQRKISKNKTPPPNYAAQLLSWDDDTIDSTTKSRLHRKLSKIDDSFMALNYPEKREEFNSCCNSAIAYLRSRTRENHLVQEENINYGFCKNLLANKPIGIALCLCCLCFIAIWSWYMYKRIFSLPLQLYFAVFFNLALLLFWVFGVTESFLEIAGKNYAKTLIFSIDSIEV